MTNSDNKRILAAAAVGLVATGVAIYAYNKSQSVSETESTAVQEKTVTPTLSKEKTSSILEEITVHMSNVMMQLAKIEQQVRTESAQTGRHVPEDQLSAFLGQQFEENLKAVSNKVYESHGTCEEETQASITAYESDPGVAALLYKLQQIVAVATGQNMQPVPNADGSMPEEIPLTSLIAIVEDTFETMAIVMESTCKALVDEGVPADQINEKLQQRYTQQADVETLKIFDNYGVSREAFHNATIKFGQDEVFLQKMQVLQERQAARFKEATAALNLTN